MPLLMSLADVLAYDRIIRHLTRIETILERQEKRMSTVSDALNALAGKITDLESAEEAVGESLVAEIKRAEDRIAALEAEIAAGVATPEDLALIAQLSDRVDALKAQAGIEKAEADAAPADPGATPPPAPAPDPAPAPSAPQQA